MNSTEKYCSLEINGSKFFFYTKNSLKSFERNGQKSDYQVTFSDGLMMTLFEFFCKFVLFCSSEMKKNENEEELDSVLV